MRQHRFTIRWVICILILSAHLSCSISGPLREDHKAKSFQLAFDPIGWAELKEKADADKAWHNPKTGAIMSVRSLCDRYEHVSLRNLSKNLQDVLDDVEVLDTQSRSIASREAYDSLIVGTLDGVKVQSRIVVVRKNHCLFDFVITENPTLSSSSKVGFEKLLGSFDYQGENIK